MERLMPKNFMKIAALASFSWVSLSAYAETGDGGQKPANQKETHEMMKDEGSMMGMMADCRQMMGEDTKFPMHDAAVSIKVTETADGAIVKWTANEPAAIERIQKMARHMEQMKGMRKN